MKQVWKIEIQSLWKVWTYMYKHPTYMYQYVGGQTMNKVQPYLGVWNFSDCYMIMTKTHSWLHVTSCHYCMLLSFTLTIFNSIKRSIIFSHYSNVLRINPNDFMKSEWCSTNTTNLTAGNNLFFNAWLLIISIMTSVTKNGKLYLIRKFSVIIFQTSKTAIKFSKLVWSRQGCHFFFA